MTAIWKSLASFSLLLAAAFSIVPGAAAAAPTAAVRPAPVRAAAALGPLINIPQTWNNCGPSSVAEVLAYWGIQRDQEQVKAVLRADGNPYGMAPYAVPAYMRSLGLRALMGVAGTERVVKALVSNGFPVIVSQYVSLAYKVGHYRPIQAYDDKQGVFVSSDPYLGQNHAIDYREFDAIWQSSGRRFMVLYPPSRQSLLNAVLADARWNRSVAYQQDLLRQDQILRGVPGIEAAYHGPKNAYLSIAWDNLQLGRYSASRQALQMAVKKGANPVVVGWVSNELRFVSGGKG